VKKAILSAIIIMLTASSCGGAAEIENRGFVTAIGVDRGENGRFEVTVSVPDAAAVAGSGGGEKQTVRSAVGDTLSEALRAADMTYNGKLYYGHATALVLGNGLLSDGPMLRETLDTLMRSYEFNNKILVLAADGTPSADGRAAEIIKTEPAGSRIPSVGFYASDFYKNRSGSSNITFELSLENLMNTLSVCGNALLPMISAAGKNGDKDEPLLNGICVVKDYSFAGRLDERQARGLLWLRGEGVGSKLTADLDGSSVPMTVTKNSCNIRFKENEAGDGLVCAVTVRAEGTVAGRSFIDTELTDGEVMYALEKKYEDAIADDVFALADCLLGELKTDAFPFSEILRKKYWKLYSKYCVADWEDHFRRTEIELWVSVRVLNAGMMK